MNTQQTTDEQLLRHTLELAARGVGLVSPNPLVGCTIVSADGKIVGEGTYLKDGVTHAEVIALEKAGEKARGGTAYVSLEPHDHHGRTPPCTEALINAGIERVVCPIEDPNPLVSGTGFKRLRGSGVEVSVGLLAADASKQNEKFICWHTKKRPFVHLKLAMSLDGRISLGQSVSTTLSGDSALERVHEIRHEHDAILVGSNTAVIDDPSLTDRSGKPRRRPLVRIVLDNRLRLPAIANVIRTASEVPTLVFYDTDKAGLNDELHATGAEFIGMKGGSNDLPTVLQELHERDIQSVLVEGGTAVAGAFVDAKLVDKVTFIYSPLIIGGNAPTAVGGHGAGNLDSAFHLNDLSIIRHGKDIEITGYPE